MGYPILTYIIIAIIILSWLAQLYYYLGIYAKPGFSNLPKRKSDKPFVSVIICARNEADNLRTNLPQILEQDYPDFEVIVVNDASTDDSDEVLKQLSGKYSHLRTTVIKKDDKFTHSKKLAVLVGIKAAKSEYLLFTDADCIPATDQWIRLMVRNFTKNTEFVLGYGGYKEKGGLLNNFVRYDTFFIALQYLGFAMSGKPYMGVGRNLAYKKQVFFRNKGFGKNNKLLSGDDDLIVNAQAHKNNTRVETDAGAKTLSIPPGSWSEWFGMKRRHITTAGSYRNKSLLLIGGELFSRILFYAGLIAFGIFSTFASSTVLFSISGALLLRWIVMFVVFRAGARRLEEKHLLLSSFFYDILSPFVYFGIWISNLFSTKPVVWK